MALPNYFQDPSVLHLNTTPHRTTPILFRTLTAPVLLQAYVSSPVILRVSTATGISITIRVITNCLTISFRSIFNIKFPCHQTGRTTASTIITTPISTTRSHLIHHLYRRIRRVGSIIAPFISSRMPISATCSTLRGWTPACFSM